MKIVFTSKGKDWNSKIDSRFGRADYLFVYDTEIDATDSIDNRSVADEAHGAGIKTAKLIYDIKPNVLITGNGPGNNSVSVLNELNVQIYTGAESYTIKDALEAYKRGVLTKFNN